MKRLLPRWLRPTPARFNSLFVAWAALTPTLALGCAHQAEGERCDPRNFNRDCESGLECVELRSLAPGERPGAICCPENSRSGECATTTLQAPEPDAPPADAGGMSRGDGAAPADSGTPPDGGPLVDAGRSDIPADAAGPTPGDASGPDAAAPSQVADADSGILPGPNSDGAAELDDAAAPSDDAAAASLLDAAP